MLSRDFEIVEQHQVLEDLRAKGDFESLRYAIEELSYISQEEADTYKLLFLAGNFSCDMCYGRGTYVDVRAVDDERMVKCPCTINKRERTEDDLIQEDYTIKRKI